MPIAATSVRRSAIVAKDTFYKLFMIFQIDHRLIFGMLIKGADRSLI
jgi:hypothetical protein